jgi:hypothetical protein
MEKSIKTPSNPHIRAIEPEDFAFIRSLAAEFPTFTVPSEYLLWFLSRFHPSYCRVIEQGPGSLKAYLLAMPSSEPQNGIAIWQVAAAASDHSFALEYFAAYLRELVGRSGATSISFTTPKASASLRLIRSLAKQFFDCDAIQVDSVPAGQNEYEFRLSIAVACVGDEAAKKFDGTK